MIKTLWDFLLNLPLVFSDFLSWLTKDLGGTGFTPLSIISLAGISFIIGFLIVRLIAG